MLRVDDGGSNIENEDRVSIGSSQLKAPNLNKTFDMSMMMNSMGNRRSEALSNNYSNKQSSIKLGNADVSPARDWQSMNKEVQAQAADFKYSPIGKYERSLQYKKTQFQMGLDSIQGGVGGIKLPNNNNNSNSNNNNSNNNDGVMVMMVGNSTYDNDKRSGNSPA